MSKERDAVGGPYKSFEQLFNDAANYMDAIKGSIKPSTRHYDLASFNLEFNTWLVDKCNWNGERDTYYDHFLTKDFFLKFMEHKAEQENELIAALELERQSWEIRKPELTTQQELTKKEKTDLTQRQKAIVLYFKQEADLIPRLTRSALLNSENGSAKLYNMVLQVSKGQYKLDDLENAIEFLIEFPAAHSLAIKEFKKRNPLT